MNTVAINLQEKFARFREPWSPKVIAEMNDYQFKLVRLIGEFVWHDHADTDEVFIVIEGEMVLRLRDREVPLRAGELYVVPKGVEHQPFAAQECKTAGPTHLRDGSSCELLGCRGTGSLARLVQFHHEPAVREECIEALFR